MKPQYLATWLIVISMWAAIGYASTASVPPDRASPLWRLAAQEQAMMEERGIVLGEASLTAYLQGVADRLWTEVSCAGLSTPIVKVVMDTRIDAFAYPNGHCFLSTGILDVLDNESQLAMVLSHEMVHYARQHTAELYTHFQKTVPQFDRQNANLNAMTGGRAMQEEIDAAERQADMEGLSILKAAGYDENEVLPLISSLKKHMLEQGHAETVAQLEQRAAFFKMQIELDHGRQPGMTPTDSDPDVYHDRIAPALMANAQIALRRGDWDQAGRSISRLLTVKPDDARAYYLKGEVQRRQNNGGHDNPCIGSYKKALKIDPNFSLAHRALGELHYKAGRYRMAKPYFETFLSLAPRDKAREFIKGYLRQCQN